eukprot:Opistho-2@89994
MGCHVSRAVEPSKRERVGVPDGAPSSSLTASASADVLLGLVNALRNGTSASRCVRIYLSVSSDETARSLLCSKFLPELRGYLYEKCGVDASFVTFEKIDPQSSSVARAIALRLREIEACDLFVGVCGASHEETVKALLQLEASSEHKDHVSGVSSHVNQLWRDFPNMRIVLSGGVFGVGAVERHFARTAAKDKPAMLFYERGISDRISSGKKRRSQLTQQQQPKAPLIADPAHLQHEDALEHEAAAAMEGGDEPDDLPVARLSYRRACANGRDCSDIDCQHCAKEIKKSLQNIAKATAATLPSEERALDGTRKNSAAFEYSGPGTCAEEICRMLRMAFALATPSAIVGDDTHAGVMDAGSRDNSLGEDHVGSLSSAEHRASLSSTGDRRGSLTSERRLSLTSHENRRGSTSSDRRGSINSTDRRGSISSTDRRGSVSSTTQRNTIHPELTGPLHVSGSSNVETATSSLTAPFPPPIVYADPHRAFMRVKAAAVPIGDSRMRSLLERIESEFADSPDGLGPVVACGSEGMGKTSLAACWLRREFPGSISADYVGAASWRRESLVVASPRLRSASLTSTHNSPRLQPIVEWQTFVFYHSAGCTPESLLASNMLTRLCRMLSLRLGVVFDDSAAESGLDRLLIRAGRLILTAHKQRLNVYIVIDDFDLLAADDINTTGLRVASKSGVVTSKTARSAGANTASSMANGAGSSMSDNHNSVTINMNAVAASNGGGSTW